MTTTSNQHRVLVVEDDQALLHGIVRGLGNAVELVPIPCANAEEALREVRSGAPDLVITDINLPGSSGIDLVASLKSHHPELPVIVMTAFRSNFSQALADLGSLTVLEKPVSLVNLRRLVDEKLHRPLIQRSLGPFSLVDYLQLAGMGGHSAVVQVSLPNQVQGAIEIVEGNIWNAFVGDLDGEAALAEMVTAELAGLVCRELEAEPTTRQIERRWDGLLLDLLRERDEANRDQQAGNQADDFELDLLAGPEGADETQLLERCVTEVTRSCQQMRQQVETCWLVGLVDLQRAGFVGEPEFDGQGPQQEPTPWAEWATELLAGPTVNQLAKLAEPPADREQENPPESLMVTGGQGRCFVLRLPGVEAAVIVGVPREMPVALGWTIARKAVREIRGVLR